MKWWEFGWEGYSLDFKSRVERIFWLIRYIVSEKLRLEMILSFVIWVRECNRYLLRWGNVKVILEFIFRYVEFEKFGRYISEGSEYFVWNYFGVYRSCWNRR